MNIATFSTRDLQEQGGKSYVASYWESEELVIPWIFFLQTTSNEGDSQKFSSADDSQYTVCDCLSEKMPSLHLPVLWKIPFWKFNLKN